MTALEKIKEIESTGRDRLFLLHAFHVMREIATCYRNELIKKFPAYDFVITRPDEEFEARMKDAPQT